MGRTTIIAGACGYGRWPPNTLEGAVASARAGVDGVEIDVHLTADGVVVAHHDYRLDPDQTRLDGEWIAERGPPLKERTLAELRRYDLGRTRPGSRGDHHPARQGLDGARIPTLPDLLKALRAEGRPIELYVEIKTSPQAPKESSDHVALTAAVVADLRAAGHAPLSRIIAFDWRVLRWLAEHHPDLATSHLSIPAALEKDVRRDANGDSPWADGCDPRHFDGDVLRAIRAHGGTCWSGHVSEITPERVACARGLGLEVAAWGVDRSSQTAAMRDLGVASVTLSDPAQAEPG